MRAKVVGLAVGATFATLVATSAGAITVTNGCFEDVQITSSYSTVPADIPGWTHSGDVGDALIWNATYPICCGGTGTAKTGDGNQFVTMGGGYGPFGSSAWSQDLTGFTVGQAYVVHFKMAAEGESPTQDMTVSMTSGSSTAPETFTSPPTSTLFWQNWGANSYSFVADATSATLQFSVTNQQWDVGLDSVSVNAAVPEPKTWAMMLVGFLGIAFAGYRGSRRSAEVAA